MSAFGTKRTSRPAQPMSAFGGKADISSEYPECLLVTPSGPFFNEALSCAHSRSDSITGRDHVAPAPHGPILCVFPACRSRRPMIHFIKFYQIMLTVERSELCQSEDRSRRSHAITRALERCRVARRWEAKAFAERFVCNWLHPPSL